MRTAPLTRGQGSPIRLRRVAAERHHRDGEPREECGADCRAADRGSGGGGLPRAKGDGRLPHQEPGADLPLCEAQADAPWALLLFP